ncbi:MAG TPA: M48 family metalloprotease [Bdellovibrionota bacterium]|nr:M48 family metalloprotease [Bdellovibrionota bacterium]
MTVDMNVLRTTFLMALLTVLFVYVGRALGGQQGMVMAFGFAVVMNFFSYWFSDKIVLAMYHAKEVTEAEAPELYSIIRGLVTKASLSMPRVYIIPNPTPNAFATGRNPKHGVVAVTQGILQLLVS